MAEYIKYFTNNVFKRTDFADMLRYKMNVSAGVVDDGVILDREAFNAVSLAKLPEWARLNKRFINSDLHTRAATEREIFRLLHPTRYTLVYFSRDQWTSVTEGADVEELKEQAQAIQHADCIGILDQETGELVYEVGL